jgi:hypothetical protein
MPSRGKTTKIAIIRSKDLGFPPEGYGETWEVHLNDAFITYKTSPSPAPAKDRNLGFSPGIHHANSIQQHTHRGDPAHHLRWKKEVTLVW